MLILTPRVDCTATPGTRPRISRRVQPRRRGFPRASSGKSQSVQSQKPPAIFPTSEIWTPGSLRPRFRYRFRSLGSTLEPRSSNLDPPPIPHPSLPPTPGSRTPRSASQSVTGVAPHGASAKQHGIEFSSSETQALRKRMARHGWRGSLRASSGRRSGPLEDRPCVEQVGK